LEDKTLRIEDSEILITRRIGIDYAGEDAKLPYRFVVK
jgi:DNA-3-methyladenine glycosylase